MLLFYYYAGNFLSTIKTVSTKASKVPSNANISSD